MPGRPKKTLDELRRSGTYRPSRHGHRLADEAVFNSAAPDKLPCPSGLKGAAAAFWDRLATVLTGRLVESDGPLLASACHWLAEEQRCRKALAKLKPISVEHSRALRGAVAAAAAAEKILSQFGLTPAARAKLPPVFGERPKSKVMTRSDGSTPIPISIHIPRTG